MMANNRIKMEVVDMTKKSPKFSFSGWEIWQFIKGRKKTAITLIAAALGYVIGDSTTIAAVSGGAVEIIWALCEYYIKEL